MIYSDSFFNDFIWQFYIFHGSETSVINAQFSLRPAHTLGKEKQLQ